MLEENTADFAWHEVLDAFRRVWPGDDLIYSESPVELIYRLRDERDAAHPEAASPELRKSERVLLANLETTDVNERTVTLTVSTALWENWQTDWKAHIASPAPATPPVPAETPSWAIVDYPGSPAHSPVTVAALPPALAAPSDALVRKVHGAARHIWALSAPEHGMMMVRADDAERIMRLDILGETFTPSDAKGETP